MEGTKRATKTSMGTTCATAQAMATNTAERISGANCVYDAAALHCDAAPTGCWFCWFCKCIIAFAPPPG
jgi:hypothetical protein